MRSMKTTLLTSLAFAAVLCTPAAGGAETNALPGGTAGQPTFTGTPNLGLAMAFIDSGGGPGDFSTVRAMDRMIGTPAFQADLQKLAAAYGPAGRDRFVRIFDYAINDAWYRAGRDNLAMPSSSGETGRRLAAQIIRAGTAPDGAFWGGYLLDRMLSQRVAAEVLRDIDAKYGPGTATQFLRMANRFFFEVSQQVGSSVALAPLH
jgi:hypothetical protein